MRRLVIYTDPTSDKVCILCDLPHAYHVMAGGNVHAVCFLEWLKTQEGQRVVINGDLVQLNFGIEK